MPAKKTTAASKPKTTKKTTTNKKPTTKKLNDSEKTAVPSSGQMIVDQIMPYILGCVALFVIICFILTDASGVVGKGLRTLLYGLFSSGAVTVPVFIINAAVFLRRDREKKIIRYRIIFSFIVLVFISVLIHVFTSGGESLELKLLWENGLKWKGGGAVGGFLGALLLKGIGTAGTLIVAFSMLIIFVMYLIGVTPRTIGVFISYRIHEYKERLAEDKLFKEEKEKRVTKNTMMTVVDADDKGKERPFVNIEFEDDEPYDNAVDPNIFDDTPDNGGDIYDENFEIITPEKNQPRIRKKAEDIEGELKLDEIFTETAEDNLIDDMISRFVTGESENDEPDDKIITAETDMALEIERSKVVVEPRAETQKKEPDKPVYVLPPVTLLHVENAPKNNDVSEELQSTAKKLVETLASFKVKTKIVNFSRGPTITRYELAPDEGVRVKAISNLVDDIALNLATSGVRIEAPIPGKAAVGIEVPNRTVATVYLRELLENPDFKKTQSKITIALGVDVANEPVYADIRKMVHVLIAGATGTGKSVCINSIIMSLLYKASPEEVKLIMVDPKKVELNVYNGLPHLLVPVVSDSKKAAGSLNWAVTEMERRYELLEEVGVREIMSYNKVTANDPEKEFLPQIVIIIDELADLMMTAKDMVEESIVRLAQKARAAGMHLILGTQRPSVDVVTGLIKANIPSRIAFTMASQTDARTVELGGAEKLIGRGDMLFNPMGAAKPIRVQGSFVSEEEVEAVVDFIKRQGYEASYDDNVMESIERAADEIGTGKRGASAIVDDGGDGGSDPMLKAAIELAVESDKISTSLIQRRLSLGYGRAAKLIDTMEEMGIVGKPEGQKPRKVLISKQQYMEMVLNRDELY